MRPIDVTARANLYVVHRASFILWFGAMSVHVLGHLVDTARLAPRDGFGKRGATSRVRAHVNGCWW